MLHGVYIVQLKVNSSHLGFRSSITLCFLKSPIKCRLQIGGGRIAVLTDKVNDGVDHIKVSASQGRSKIPDICVKNVMFVAAKEAICFEMYQSKL